MLIKLHFALKWLMLHYVLHIEERCITADTTEHDLGATLVLNLLNECLTGSDGIVFVVRSRILNILQTCHTHLSVTSEDGRVRHHVVGVLEDPPIALYARPGLLESLI